MGIGIIDGAVDSIEAMRKVLIVARSIPRLVIPPEKPLAVVVNASVSAAILLLVNRLMLYLPDTSASNYFAVIGLNILIAATSLVPIFVVSIVAIFIPKHEHVERTADSWLIVITFVWIMTLTVHLIAALYAAISGDGDNLRTLANYILPGLKIPVGTLTIDSGAFVLCLIFTIIAFAILIWRTWLVSKPNTVCSGDRSCIVTHVFIFMLAAFPSTVLLALTLYATKS